jgi:sporulation protein YlmC with PRC-barrel domain
MILSDILGREVVDVDGVRLGYAVDVRFVVSGAPSQLLAEAVLDSLLVSPKNRETFLGYERSGVVSPWPIGKLLERRHRGSFFVAWRDIASFGSDAVHVRAAFTRLPLREDD